MRWRRTIRAILVMVFCLTLLLAPDGSVPVNADSLADRIAAARQRQADFQRAIDRQRQLLDQLNGEGDLARSAIDSTGKQLDGINANQAAIRKDIGKATASLARVQSRRDLLIAELRGLDWTLALLEHEIADGSAELDSRRRLLGARLAEAYRSQNTSLLEQLLGAGSFTDVLTNASAYLAYGDQDALLAQDIGTDQAALDSLRALTAATRYRTDTLRRGAQAAEADLVIQQGKLRDARARSIKLETKVNTLKAHQLAAAKRILGHAKRSKAAIARQAAADRKLDNRIAGLVAEAQRRAEARREAPSALWSALANPVAGDRALGNARSSDVTRWVRQWRPQWATGLPAAIPARAVLLAIRAGCWLLADEGCQGCSHRYFRAPPISSCGRANTLLRDSCHD